VNWGKDETKKGVSLPTWNTSQARYDLVLSDEQNWGDDVEEKRKSEGRTLKAGLAVDMCSSEQQTRKKGCAGHPGGRKNSRRKGIGLRETRRHLVGKASPKGTSFTGQVPLKTPADLEM